MKSNSIKLVLSVVIFLIIFTIAWIVHDIITVNKYNRFFNKENQFINLNEEDTKVNQFDLINDYFEVPFEPREYIRFFKYE
ncbi:hypothetical protein [Chengkuizengella axinellae]|uniref:DUF3139 domain-containing protein n=1 Tax=Chengkuizengella axinellae TaxID=3064388 RepID=A0ABT9ITR9_9BACL|nr:hypothetical protein [Chengkuizengella sp. 2205SS18-9]MDP5272749.1 hypothetical protein [Chengkuizengella sp. 2205SS18-9]